MKEMELQKQYQIEQVAVTMAVEEMLAWSIASFQKGNNTGLEVIFRKCISLLSES